MSYVADPMLDWQPESAGGEESRVWSCIVLEYGVGQVLEGLESPVRCRRACDALLSGMGERDAARGR